MIDESCTFNKYQSYYNIAGIVALILILITAIIYYLYIKRKSKKEEFENTGCFFDYQGNIDTSEKINVEMRDCEIYFTEKEEDCDKYYKYYNMTLIELDKEILSTKDDILNKKLLEIKEDKINNLEKNNINQCKYKLEGWKELHSYNDSIEDTNNIIYPHKNTTRQFQDSSYKNLPLLNSCFKEYDKSDKDIKYIDNDIIYKSCSYPINKLNDIKNNNKNQQYSSINFDNLLPFDKVRNNICKNINSYSLNINERKIFMKFNCYYKDNKLYLNDISFVRFNNNTYQEIKDKIENDKILLNLFRVSYNNSLKQIYYGNKRLNTNSCILQYDMCNNIYNKIINNFSFTLNDFLNITESKLVSSVDLIELINILDANINNSDETKDYLNDIKININKLSNMLITDISELNNDINKINTDIRNIRIYISNIDSSVSDLEKEIKSNNDLILKARNNTDKAIENLKAAIAKAKAAVDAERKRISDLNSSNKKQTETTNADNQKKYNDRVAAIARISAANDDIASKNIKARDAIINEYETTRKVNQTNYNNAYRSYQESLAVYNRDLAAYNNEKAINDKKLEYINNNYRNGLITRTTTYTSGKFNSDGHIGNEYEFNNRLLHNNPCNDENKNVIDENKTSENYIDDLTQKIFNNTEQYKTHEICANIVFKKSGYYHFFINSDDAGEFFLGTINPDTTSSMKLVAVYYGGHGHYFDSYTTNYPVYIDSTINNGTYALYARMHNLQGPGYIHLWYKEVTLDQVNSIYKGEYLKMTGDNFIKDKDESELVKSKLYIDAVDKRILPNRGSVKDLNTINLTDTSTDTKGTFKVPNLLIQAPCFNDKLDTNKIFPYKSFFIYYPINTLKPPINRPEPPKLPATVNQRSFTPEPLQNIPPQLELTSLSYTPLVIPSEYVDTSASTITNLTLDRDKIIQNYQSIINNDNKTIESKNNDKKTNLLTIKNKSDEIDNKKNKINENNAKIAKLSIINNNINRFNDYYDFDYIKSKIKQGFLLENQTYNNIVFQDNNSNNFILIEMNF